MVPHPEGGHKRAHNVRPYNGQVSSNFPPQWVGHTKKDRPSRDGLSYIRS